MNEKDTIDITMIIELDQNGYSKARALFTPIEFQLITRAVIEGTSPGKIYVDNNTKPTSAFMCSAEGYFLVGNPNNKEFNMGLRELIIDSIFAGDTIRKNEEELTLLIYPVTWKSKFNIIFENRPPLTLQRRYYTCTALKLNWKDLIPADYAIHQLDQEFLEHSGIEIPQHATNWMHTNWGSIEAFLDRGFGFSMIYQDRLVSWCIADCISGTECEVGIHTHPDYRRQGLASLTAAATVDYCLSYGFTKIGWHTDEDNLGSIGVAEKVGFVKTKDYQQYYCMFDEAMHLAETGYRRFQAEQYSKAIEFFNDALKRGEMPDWVYLHLARAQANLGNTEMAIKHLHQVIDRGFTNAEYLRNCEEFRILRDTREWQRMLARIKNED